MLVKNERFAERQRGLLRQLLKGLREILIGIMSAPPGT